ILDPTMEEAVFNLAALRFHNRDWPEARQILEAAVQSHPRSFRLYSLLSKVYQAMGLTEAAQRAVDHALDLNPDDRGALLQKAFLLASSGSLDQALSLLEPLKARYPQDEQVAFLLDKVRELLGKP
ncbi:tetratricopeptide repeat protein, partial [Desulfosoma sp.]